MLRRIGARLVVLLLVAELPLIVITVAAVLQNDELRARDAVSQATSGQYAALTRLASDLRVAAAIARAGGLLPASVLASRPECDSVLSTLAAANAGHIAGIRIVDGQGNPRCASTGAPFAAVPPAAGRQFGVDHGSLYVRHPIGGPGNPAVAVMLAPRRDNATDAISAEPSLWLLHAGQWLPVSASSTLPPPIDHSIGSIGKPVRTELPSGQMLLTTALPLPPDLGAAGDQILAVTDIRQASTSSARTFVWRIAELAALFVAELILIAGGVGLVAARPLKNLNTAIDRWRAGGSFSFTETASGSLEVAALARSFGQATASLDQREQDLHQSVAQQEVLMQEIHHRVKNNLQIIASLLNLQAARIKQPEARAEFQSARDRVRALATLHRYLYAHGELHMVDMRAFFAELSGQLFQAFNETEGDRIGLEIVAPDINISSDQAVPIALIVTETVGNALKYAFPGGRRGLIRIDFVVDANEQARLTIRDDGVGIDQRAAPDSGGGLGLQLIRGFAKQIGAQLTISTEPGTCYQLTMAIQRQRQNTIAFGARPVA